MGKIGSPTNENTRPKRKTPTERQVEALAGLDDDALIARALDAMFALNRRAKKIRDNRSEYRRATFARALGNQMEDIYALKDRFLDAMVSAGKAQVHCFEVEKQHGWYCEICERDFHSRDSECFGCGADATPKTYVETWYIVDCGGLYRFHQPTVRDAVAAMATPMEAHDPTQPQREIPHVGLTIDAQKACVRLATERLRAAGAGRAA